MNEKEKAIELVDKFEGADYCHGKHFPNKNYCDCDTMNTFQAKQCALICVDEVIHKTQSIVWLKGNNHKFDKEWTQEYWIKVKQEIIKLR